MKTADVMTIVENRERCLFEDHRHHLGGLMETDATPPWDGLSSSKFVCPTQMREELVSQAKRQNWDFECSEMVIMLSDSIEPGRSDGWNKLPPALQQASWRRPVPGLGYLATVRLRLADLLEVLSHPWIERIEARYGYCPLE